VQKRKVDVSNEACLCHYMRLSLNHLMNLDFILVCHQLLCHSASCAAGMIKFKSIFQGQTLGDMLSRHSISDVHLAAKQLNKMQVHYEPLHTNY
jgi:hypothetical protein